MTDARAFCREVETLYPPAPLEQLKDQLAGLLAHYYVSATDPKIVTVVAHHWLEIIKPLPGKFVWDAILKWLARPGGVKPRPGDIREIAIDLFYQTARVSWEKYQRARILADMTPVFMEAAPEKPKDEPWKPPTAEEKERVAMIVQEGLRRWSGGRENVSRETIMPANVVN